jgi:dienelactone hydrolase
VTSFTALRDQVFERYHQRRYRQALELVEGFEPTERSQDEDLHFWRMCLQSRLGETDEALATFAEALDGRHWWSETMLRDSDLDPLRELPQWKTLRKRCLDLQAKEPALEPMPMVLPPSEQGAGNGWALVVLHGAGARPEVEAEYWRAATQEGWTLVVPQSTQRFSAAGRCGWHDLERARADVVMQLEKTGWLEGGSLVVGGFSQGGGLAAHLVCAGTVDAQGLVVLGPSFGDWGVPEATAAGPVRSWILLGDAEHPRIAGAVEELSEVLRVNGWPVEIESLEGVRHSHPSDFADRLVRALRWTTSGDADAPER